MLKRLPGQAGRTIGYLLHHTGMIAMTTFLIIALALGTLAYRLSQGPLQIPWLTSRLANAVSGQSIDIRVGQAALAWAGFKNGGGAPLYLRLGDISVRNTAGVTLATIPDGNLVLLPNAIFGSDAPILVRASDAHFAGSDVPVSLTAGIRLTDAFKLSHARLSVTLGGGQFGAAGFDEPLTAGKFMLDVTPHSVALTDGQFTLTPIGASSPVIGVSGTAHQANNWQGTLTLTGNSVHAEDLAHYWPPPLIKLTRHWVTTNITGGTASDPSFTFGLSAPLDLSSMSLDAASGSFKADNLTLIWLPGVLPITGLTGVFNWTDKDDIEITAATGHLGGIALAAAHMHIAGVSHHDQTSTLSIPVSGSVRDALTVLNGPHLNLLKTAPSPVIAATGGMTGTVNVTLPMTNNLTLQDIKLNVDTVLTDVTLPLPSPGLSFTQGSLQVDATTKNLTVKGRATLAGQSASIAVSANFAPAGSPGTNRVRFDMTTIANSATLTILGLTPGSGISGQMPVVVQILTTPPGGGTVNLNADLTQAKLSLPLFGWTKPLGIPGKFSFAASLNGSSFVIDKIDRIDAHAPGLNIDTQTAGGGLNLTRIQIGNTAGSGRIVPPANPTSPWRINLTGTTLDVSSALNPSQPKTATPPGETLSLKITKPQPPSGPLWDATAHFDTLVLGQKSAPVLQDFNFDGNGQGNSVFSGNATATVTPGDPVSLAITSLPNTNPGEAEALHLDTTDGGSLLRALGAYDDLSGGTLNLDTTYGVSTPLTGTTTITKFRLLHAPAFGKILQAVTVLGIPEATSGPGLEFNKLVAPFSIANQIMTLKGARAYSSALGFTASGTIDLNTSTYDINGTVVPAYAVNALPGKIPIIGKLFSPEKGGGLFAMRYALKGPFSNPKVTMNPLSALTPGFLREIFGLGSK
jgi:hypothetical protein